MNKILTAVALTLAITAPVQAQRADMTETYAFADQAFQAFQAYDWATGVEMLNLAIEASPDACTDVMYGEYINVALEAQQLQMDGRSAEVAYQWYSRQSNAIEADCYP
jgi:hypothetical protein